MSCVLLRHVLLVTRQSALLCFFFNGTATLVSICSFSRHECGGGKSPLPPPFPSPIQLHTLYDGLNICLLHFLSCFSFVVGLKFR